MSSDGDGPARVWPRDLDLRAPDRAPHGDASVILRSVRDFDGFHLWANRAYLAMLGWSMQELSSVPYWELLHPDDQHPTVELSDRMLLTGTGSLYGVEVRMLRRDGSYRCAVFNARSIPREERVYSVGVAITGRAPIERHKVVVGSWDWHAPTNTASWSGGMFEIYRLLPGTTWSLETAVANIHPDDQHLVMRAIQWSLNSGELYLADHRIVHPGGDIRWLHSAGRVIPDHNGDPERMRGITLDVTGRTANPTPG